MKTPESVRHLRIAIILVLSVLVLGTVGYMLIEELSFVDALYTTIDMMATVGNVVRPLSEAGRLFTIVVIVFGVGSLLYTFGVGMEFVIEGHFSQAIRRHFMDNKIAALRNHSIVCGFGRVGSQIVEKFAAARISFVVLDEKESNVRACVEHGYLALQGDATSDDTLREAGIERAKCVLVATEDDAHNISITLSARHLNSQLFIVARANHDETEAKLKLAGADRVLSPYTIAGHRMANLAIQPGGGGSYYDIATCRQDATGGSEYPELWSDDSGLEKGRWIDSRLQVGGTYRSRRHGHSCRRSRAVGRSSTEKQRSTLNINKIGIVVTP